MFKFNRDAPHPDICDRGITFIEMSTQYAQPNGAKKRASKAPYGGGKMAVGQVGRIKLKAKGARSCMANANAKC